MLSSLLATTTWHSKERSCAPSISLQACLSAVSALVWPQKALDETYKHDLAPRSYALSCLQVRLYTHSMPLEDGSEAPPDSDANRPRLCCRCGGHLQRIGTARRNGAQHHGDWETRLYHKACWKAMQPKRSLPPRWRKSFFKKQRRF